MCHVRGLRPRRDSSNLALVHLNATRRNDVTKEFSAFQKQAALALLEVEWVVPQTIKHPLHITTVLVNRTWKNQDIVKVDDHALVQQVKEHPVHSTLERARCVTEPKRHNAEFKLAVSSTECCLERIVSIHGQLMVPVPEVQFAKNFRALQRSK